MLEKINKSELLKHYDESECCRGKGRDESCPCGGTRGSFEKCDFNLKLKSEMVYFCQK